jgi:ATP-binding cassette, subfamily C, bacterial
MTTGRPDEVVAVLKACRHHFATAAVFSLAINLLYLASPIYMLQVYDRVISSGSEVTLLMLTLMMLFAFAALAGLDCVRAGLLTRASTRIDRLLSARVVGAMMEASVRGGAQQHQGLRDFDSYRLFITGSGITAIFDLPWTPTYILIIYFLHPALGAFALVCAIVHVVMAVLSEFSVRSISDEAHEVAARNYGFTEMSLRNAQVVKAMGMLPALLRRWSEDRNLAVEQQQLTTDRSAAMAATTRFLRLFMQSAILGLGAYFVIERATTPGSMFAASLLLGRALQPLEMIVSQWRNLLTARAAYRRVKVLLKAHPPRGRMLALPKPAGRLSAEGVAYVAPGTSRFILHDVSFKIEPGETVCVIGHSGAGKSTLARMIVGVITPSAGAMRLDGAEIFKRPPDAIGAHIGYLPQDIELFADTVAANICRFNYGAEGEVVRAAQLAGVYEMILRLPNGFETLIGEGGILLSGGFRQRIALARAVYGCPSVVVLDEPSSNLDVAGDAAFASCIAQLKARRTTVVIVSHRSTPSSLIDKLLVMRGGTAVAFGPPAQLLRRLNPSAPTKLRPGAQANSGRLGRA